MRSRTASEVLHKYLQWFAAKTMFLYKQGGISTSMLVAGRGRCKMASMLRGQGNYSAFIFFSRLNGGDQENAFCVWLMGQAWCVWVTAKS